MIRIIKDSNTPNILLTEGVTELNKIKALYSASSGRYTSGVGTPSKSIRKFSFDNKIYGNGEVKEQLKTDQHQKCCFCEATFTDNGYGDVEHYRPKSAYQKKTNSRLNYPGYYWLAYEWTNLLFSCQICNQKYKRSLFPLGKESTRKPNHLHANLLNKEDRLLINPLEENPSKFIRFKDEVPVEISGNEKGKRSIEAYGLERMNDTRLEHLKMLKLALTFSKIDITNRTQIKLAMDCFGYTRKEVLSHVKVSTELFNSAAKDTAKFAACVRCNFPELPVK